MAKASSSSETPVMRQYLDIQGQHPEAIILMRMGDFYEAFFQSAVDLSRIAGVALTSRNKDDPEPIPMAGVPHHAMAQHLPKLLAAGRKVAVVDQLEDPAQAKGLVKRGLTRVITAGTLIDESGLEARAANWLVAMTALVPAPDAPVGVAALDVSTGRFTVEEALDAGQLAVILARLAAAEIVVPEAVRHDQMALAQMASLCAPAAVPPVSSLPMYAWKSADARRFLCDRLQVGALDGFGIAPGDEHLAVAAAAALRYAEGSARPAQDGETQSAGLAHVRGIVRLHHARHLVIDATCRRNLDLIRNSRDGGREGTLLAAVDRTRSAPGARLLADWLARPLAEPAAIGARHDAVQFLHDRDALRDDVRDALGEVYDLERLLARIATGRNNARDLVQLAGSLAAAARVQALFGEESVAILRDAVATLTPTPDLVVAIQRVLVDEPPLAINEGGMVRDGVDAELDALRAIRTDAGAWLADYQAREAERCGLPKLKVGYNSVFGYYIELSKANADKVPPHFVRKQTLVNAERYITAELKEYEDKALGAEDRIRARELVLFGELRDAAAAALPALQRCADGLASIDVLAGLADLARVHGWHRPVIDDGLDLRLQACRHPVVEAVIGRGRFVANDTALSGASRETDVATDETSPRLAVITGPNMAGKSTYIRQVALAVILAQAGAFVPAASAHIGVCDRIFTRIGAGDELARNQSTFMVEMAETAAILNHATRRSLVVLDEVGRGTSTFDGLSLAWAITEHVHDRIGCRCLFATHYHELTDLAADRSSIVNLTVEVAEHDDDVVFLHRIVPGAAAKSYGIHVARLAGVPQSVVARAKDVLATLEQLNVSLEEHERPAARSAPQAPVQLTWFTAAESPTLNRLKALDLDSLTPKQALEALYELQVRAKKEN